MVSKCGAMGQISVEERFVETTEGMNGLSIHEYLGWRNCQGWLY